MQPGSVADLCLAEDPVSSNLTLCGLQVFGAVWDTTLQDARSSLSRLFGTWTGVLPPHVLQQVSNRMVASSSRSSNGGQQPAPTAVQPQPAPAMVAAVQQLRPQMPVLLPPFAVAGQPMQVVQQQQQGPPQFFGLQQSVLGMPQQQTFVQINGTLVPVNALQPQQVVLQPAPPQLVSQQVPQHVTPHHAMQQHTTPQHTMQAVPAAVRPPVSPGHHSWQQPPPPPPQQQQLQVGPGPMVRRAPGSPAAPAQLDGMRGPPPPPRGRQEAGRKSASPMPNSAELTNDALSKLLSNLATKGVLAAKNEAAAVRKATEFQPAFLKVVWRGQSSGSSRASSSRSEVLCIAETGMGGWACTNCQQQCMRQSTVCHACMHSMSHNLSCPAACVWPQATPMHACLFALLNMQHGRVGLGHCTRRSPVDWTVLPILLSGQVV